jgi:hypothetical protein
MRRLSGAAQHIEERLDRPRPVEEDLLQKPKIAFFATTVWAIEQGLDRGH